MRARRIRRKRRQKWFRDPIYVRIDLTQPGVRALTDAIRAKIREQLPENRPSINVSRDRDVAWIKLNAWPGMPRPPAVTHVGRNNRAALREIDSHPEGWYPDAPPPRPKPPPPPPILPDGPV